MRATFWLCLFFNSVESVPQLSHWRIQDLEKEVFPGTRSRAVFYFLASSSSHHGAAQRQVVLKGYLGAGLITKENNRHMRRKLKTIIDS